MNAKLSILKKITVAAIKRIWLSFSPIFVLSVIVFSILDNNNLLTSDDPYIVAFIFGLTCAALALVYTILDNISKLTRQKNWIIEGCLAVWCLFLITMDILFQGEEGSGLATFFAIGSLIVGVISWAFCIIRLPKWVYVAVSAACLFLLITYTVVAIRLLQTH